MKKTATLLIVVAFAMACSNLFAQLNYTGKIIPGTPVVLPGGQGNTMLYPPCLACTVPEGEAYITENGIDFTNAGCNELAEPFTNINLGDAFCGNINTYLYLGTDASRDLDWYKIVLTAPTTIYWSAFSSFPGILFILSSPCATAEILMADYQSAGVAKTISETLPAGTYYLVYTSQFYMGNGVGAPYMAKVSAVPVGEPTTWCVPAPQIPTLSEWGLIILGLSLLGFGTIYLLRRGA